MMLKRRDGLENRIVSKLPLAFSPLPKRSVYATVLFNCPHAA